MKPFLRVSKRSVTRAKPLLTPANDLLTLAHALESLRTRFMRLTEGLVSPSKCLESVSEGLLLWEEAVAHALRGGNCAQPPL